MVRSHSLHFKSFRPIRESEVIILRNKFKTIHRMSSSNLLIFPFDAKFTFDKDNLAELLFLMRIRSEFALQNDPIFQKRILRQNMYHISLYKTS